MTKILSCVNLKGGVGKTALAVNFAAYCGIKGKKTLLVDLDPQTNATFSCIDVTRWEQHASDKGTIANLLGVRRHANAEDREVTASEIIIKKVFKNVDLVPSHLDLFSIDLDLAGATAREKKLKRALSPIVDQYDIIVCDCPPNLTLPTQNALALSTHYVVPVSPDYLSGLGVGLLINRISQLMGDLEHKLKHIGIVMSRIGRPAAHREQTMLALKKRFTTLVIDCGITERVAVSESSSQHCPIFSMSDVNATREFKEVSEELLKRLGV